MTKATIAHPKIVSRDEWLVARKALLVKEKKATQARDALNTVCRRLPMIRIEKDYVFEGPHSKARLLDFFEGRRQFIIYHFMYHADQDKFLRRMFLLRGPGLPPGASACSGYYIWIHSFPPSNSLRG